MASPPRARFAPRRTVRGADARARILEAFAARAKRTGVRAVVMADVAYDLGMSKKTLYRHFESKDALVHELVKAWGERLEDGQRALRARTATPVLFFRDAAALWVDALSEFSQAFWAEVRTEHPDAHAAFVTILQASRRRMRERLVRHLRPGVDRELALEILNATVARAADPSVAARLGISTREALLGSLEVWARGALRLAGPTPRKGSRMHVARTALHLLFALLLVALPATARLASAAGKTDRFGIEGKIVAYDPGADTFKIKVTNAGVSGGFGTGGTAGGAPPDDVQAGTEIVMAVVPEGSVLKRTVIKAQQGGGLDTTGTKEGFQKALKAIPDDRSVVISFEKNPGGNPAYVVRMVQIRLTEEEIRQRIEANTVEE